MITLKGEAQHLWNRIKWSWQGYAAAFASERTLKQETVIAAVSITLTFALPLSPTERIILIILPLIVIAAELLNTAIEAVVDLASPELHPLAKKAKDCGSAAVAVLMIAFGAAWLLALFT